MPVARVEWLPLLAAVCGVAACAPNETPLTDPTETALALPDRTASEDDGGGGGAEVEGLWFGEDFSCFGDVYWFEDAYNEMELDDDGEGTAFVYFVEGDDCGVAEFDVSVVDEDDDEVVFEMDCDALLSAYGDSCMGLDFDMECTVRGDEMECDGDGVWGSYAFRWDCADGACER